MGAIGEPKREIGVGVEKIEQFVPLKRIRAARDGGGDFR